MNLFTERSIWTMVHGIILGGGVMAAFTVALYCMWSVRAADGPSPVVHRQCRFLGRTLLVLAVALWLVVLIGTYVNFAPYRAAAPEGADLSQYPKSFIQSNESTDWLHSFGMELKEHLPWMAAMLVTAVAFVALRYNERLIGEHRLRGLMAAVLLVSFSLSGVVALLGIFINKVAPLT
ncbi:MAG: hypothetical protein HY870_06575 [Chloroflexi bacterium]|nr:hypothetical protein [Chloroflexota bacterium]